MATLTAVDIVVMAMIVLGGLAGLARGFVTEVLSLAAWVAGIVALKFLYAPGKTLLLTLIHNEAAASVTAFLLIFIIAYAIVRYIAQSLGDRTRSSIVGPIDRLLGLGFGALKGLVGAAVIWLLIGLAHDKLDDGQPLPAWLEAGRTAPLLTMSTRTLTDFVATGDVAAAAPRPGEKGYKPADRDALDKLLDGTDSTAI